VKYNTISVQESKSKKGKKERNELSVVQKESRYIESHRTAALTLREIAVYPNEETDLYEEKEDLQVKSLPKDTLAKLVINLLIENKALEELKKSLEESKKALEETARKISIGSLFSDGIPNTTVINGVSKKSSYTSVHDSANFTSHEFKLDKTIDFNEIETKFRTVASSVLAKLQSFSFKILQSGESSIENVVFDYILNICSAFTGLSDTSISITCLMHRIIITTRDGQSMLMGVKYSLAMQYLDNYMIISVRFGHFMARLKFLVS
jgi:hypothetical protein